MDLEYCGFESCSMPGSTTQASLDCHWNLRTKEKVAAAPIAVIDCVHEFGHGCVHARREGVRDPQLGPMSLLTLSGRIWSVTE